MAQVLEILKVLEPHFVRNSVQETGSFSRTSHFSSESDEYSKLPLPPTSSTIPSPPYWLSGSMSREWVPDLTSLHKIRVVSVVFTSAGTFKLLSEYIFLSSFYHISCMFLFNLQDIFTYCTLKCNIPLHKCTFPIFFKFFLSFDFYMMPFWVTNVFQLISFASQNKCHIRHFSILVN